MLFEKETQKESDKKSDSNIITVYLHLHVLLYIQQHLTQSALVFRHKHTDVASTRELQKLPTATG